MSNNRNHDDYLQKAAMYDLLAQYYKYLDPSMHIHYYQKHIRSMNKAMSSLRAQSVANYYQSNSPARIRVLHASPDAPNVDIYINGNRILRDFSFKETSNYLSLPAGRYQIDIYPAGDMVSTVLSRKVTVEAGKQYTVAAADIVEKLKLVVIEDHPVVPSGETKVRFVHLSPDTQPVDIAVKNGDVVFRNIGFRRSSDYLPLSPLTVDLEVRATGTKDVLLPISGLTFQRNQVYTLVAVGLSNGEPSIEPIVLTERE
ncbi:DUF4397 domain-containing protein [Robertmurraya korlensis]|uniref:DUF4397 domain-containing protein n=1 Tax=Robertmurraya korlensis TaxID=519977 RepID=UPI000825B01D|nr:DUF4397 domain-containing protein [Robertmurraya korlensis]